jgi:hypothetical protein
MVLHLLEEGLEARGREVRLFHLFAISDVYNLETSKKCVL